MARYGDYPPYVPVAQRRAQARKQMERLRKKGKNIQPIEIEGRKITRTFWGDAWCEHLEQYSDYSNRLPRGRTYVRNGSVCHLNIDKGKIDAMVSGSSLYEINIKITPLSATRWRAIKQQCTGQIGSLIELLQGKLSKQIMEVVTHPKHGLFPSPKEINLDCDCPDWASLCKHLAAVLYGIGAKLDQNPELLFLLRGVDHHDLISSDVKIPETTGKRRRVSGDLSNVFGVKLEEDAASSPKRAKKKVATTTQSSTPRKSSTPSQSSAATQSTSAKPKSIRPTGKSVARLRQRFDMNLSQFSRLIGVSAKSISAWENQPARLNLRPENLAALTNINDLSKEQAWERL